MSETSLDDKRSQLQAGTRLEGSFQSQRPVTVNGELRGQLAAPELEVTHTGSVHGEIRVDRLSCRGKISGQVEAGRLVLSGWIGDCTYIRADRLEVAQPPDGAPRLLRLGECQLEVGEDPALQLDQRPPGTVSTVPRGVSLLPSTAPRSGTVDEAEATSVPPAVTKSAAPGV